MYMANITLKKKGKMYECIAFFDNGTPKKWKYVRDLQSFGGFLNKSHSSWKYFNVYEKGTKQYLKRFYPGNSIPKVLSLFCLGLLTQKFTFNNTFKTFISCTSYPVKNTFALPFTFTATFTNGFNNTATFPTLPATFKKGGVQC